MTVSHVIVELWEKKTFHSVNSSVLQLELTDIPFKNKVTKNQNGILASFFHFSILWHFSFLLFFDAPPNIPVYIVGYFLAHYS